MQTGRQWAWLCARLMAAGMVAMPAVAADDVALIGPGVIRSDADPDAATDPLPDPAWTEIQGYARYGFAISDGHSPACYKLAGAPAKYRFGNECDNHGAIKWSQRLAQFGGGVHLAAFTETTFNQRVNHAPGLRDTDAAGKVRLPQAYLQLMGLSSLPGARLFFGRISYREADIPTLDYSYWNPSGLGAGIENLPIGRGLKLSYALFLKDTIEQVHYATRHDLQLSGMRTNSHGELFAGLSYIPRRAPITGANGLRQDAHAGWSITGRHVQTKVLGGKHEFAVQFGVGPGAGLGATGPLTYSTAFKSLRIINVLDWQLTRDFGGLADALIQRDIAPHGHASQTWVSLGARLAYALTRHVKLVGDFGRDQIKPDDQGARMLTKATVALVLAKDRAFWSRPELRLFWSRARWNRLAQLAAEPGDPLSETGVFGAARAGSTVGLQVETWF